MLNMRLLWLMPKIFRYTAKSVLFQWLSFICNIVITIFICHFLNYCLINKTSDINIILKTSIVIILCIIFRTLCSKLYTTNVSELSQKAKKLLRENIFDCLCKIGISYNNYVTTAEAVQISVEGVEQLEIYYSQYIPQLFYSFVSVSTIFIFLCFISINTALILLLCIPIIPISIILVQKFAKKLLSKYWNSYTNLGDTFLENIQGLTTLKIYSCDEKKQKEMNDNAELFRKATMKVLIMQLNSISIMDIVAYGGTALGIIVSINEFINGNISFFETTAIIFLSSEFFIPLRQLGSFFHVAMNGAVAAEKIFRLLDIKIDDNAKDIFNTNYFDVCFNNVSFSYNNKKSILKNISFKLADKGLYAIAGKSGDGKSTIASLISGRLNSYNGNINFGNTELKKISEKELMNTVTLVGHNSHIFKGTIEYNLKIGKKNISNDEMIKALEKVNLLEFINSENGLETKISEQGSNLSGGQKQRLAIARAFLHNTPIYIFDEATSNIDSQSEENIINIISELAKEKIVILISHRIANIKNADRIYVLKDGSLIEEGTHKELIKNNSHYAKLYFKQQSLEKYSSGGYCIE